MLPENVLKDIVELACPPPAFRIWNEQRRAYTFAIRPKDKGAKGLQPWSDIGCFLDLRLHTLAKCQGSSIRDN